MESILSIRSMDYTRLYVKSASPIKDNLILKIIMRVILQRRYTPRDIHLSVYISANIVVLMFINNIIAILKFENKLITPNLLLNSALMLHQFIRK